jgi:hypothetical protein
MNSSKAPFIDSLKKRDGELASLQGGNRRSPGQDFTKLSFAFASLFNTLQEADLLPTTQATKSIHESETSFNELYAKWKKLR